MSASGMISALIDSFQISAWPRVAQILVPLSPVFLAVILCVIFWHVWLQYTRAKQFFGLKYIVLELRLPKETNKSPLAMESFLHSIHNTSDGGKYAQYWLGETRPWYSLEMVSIEGQVKFMIWTEDRRKGGLSAALYAQYPGIEIYEREDYTKSVHYDPENTKIWAAEFVFTKPDPYPIKTYVDYGLDKDPKEEFKVDPLSAVIEFLGAVKPNQQVWMQLIVRAHKDDQRKPGHLMAKTDLWKDESKDLVDELMKRDPHTKVAGEENEETGLSKKPSLSKGETEVISAIERSMTKLAFDVGIRALYITPKAEFDGPFGIGGIISSYKQFTTESLNGLRPNGERLHAKFNSNPWEDYRSFRKNRETRYALMAYKRRSFFYGPAKFRGKTLVMNTEELATIYHFPGSTSASPALERVPSKKSEAPTNLPV